MLLTNYKRWELANARSLTSGNLLVRVANGFNHAAKRDLCDAREPMGPSLVSVGAPEVQLFEPKVSSFLSASGRLACDCLSTFGLALDCSLRNW
jgi:hypothetical protein